MASDDDYEVYQYSDEDGYSIADSTEDMDLDPNENPNAPPVQYSKIGMSFVLVVSRTFCVALVRKSNLHRAVKKCNTKSIAPHSYLFQTLS